jgi:hypothetical protein
MLREMNGVERKNLAAIQVIVIEKNYLMKKLIFEKCNTFVQGL